MGDWEQALLIVLFAAKLGLAADVLMIILNLLFALTDHLTEIGGVFGLYLLIFAGAEIWLRSHLRRLQKDHHKYEARHRSKLRSTMQEISEMHKNWTQKRNEDQDGLFTFWVLDKESQPSPLF